MRILNHTGCTKIALLAVAGALAAGSLDAGIVYSLADYSLTLSGSTYARLYLRLDGTTVEGTDTNGFSTLWGSVDDAYATYSTSDGSHVGAGAGNANFRVGESTLSVGAKISATDYTSWTARPSLSFSDTGTYYVPFKALNRGANSDQTYYGYFELNYVQDTSLTLVGGALEDTGAAITVAEVAAAVPEPSETAGVIGSLAGVAALGVALKRRKNRA